MKFKDEILEPLEVEIEGKTYTVKEDKETLEKADKVTINPDGSNITEFWHAKLHLFIDIPKSKVKGLNLRRIIAIVKWIVGQVYGTPEVAETKKDS